MKDTLGRSEKIKVSTFGNFELRDKRPRQGRNPQTGDPIVITERRVLSFKASNILKQGLNPSRGDLSRDDMGSRDDQAARADAALARAKEGEPITSERTSFDRSNGQ